jgi:uncharacterized membrane protein HdeD (DUF308 family)
MTSDFQPPSVHVLEHAATIILGIVLAILGLSLIFTVVFVLPGILTLLAGICLIVSGIFAHPGRARR